MYLAGTKLYSILANIMNKYNRNILITVSHYIFAYMLVVEFNLADTCDVL